MAGADRTVTGMRVYASSRGLDPAALQAGRDLVLEIDEAHGVDLAFGAHAHDWLDVEDRAAVDRAAVQAIADWRAVHDAALTIDAIVLPWLWEWELLVAFNPVIRAAAGLRNALVHHGHDRVVVADPDPGTVRLVRAVAASLDIAVQEAAEPAVRAAAGSVQRPQRAVRRLRRGAMTAVTQLGIPSWPRAGSILFYSYWPLVPLLDRMLADGSWRPAIPVLNRPPGPRRFFAAARRGGWMGAPGPARRRRAGRLAAAATERVAAAPVPDLQALGLVLGAPLHAAALGVARSRAARDLANAAVLRRALRTGRITRLIAPNDIEPDARLAVRLAQEASVRTVCLCHGAYVLPQPLSDLEVCDEVALWTRAVAPPIANWDRPIHCLGYPLPHRPVPTRPPRNRARPRILVPSQSWLWSTAMMDARIIMRHYVTALEAIQRRLPRARVVLRPHPSHDLAPVEVVTKQFAALDLTVDVASDIMRLLSEVDLVIGSASTAAFQAALVGTPVIMLATADFDWNWPLGGATSVPVARSADELVAHLDGWAREGTAPGADDLLAAIGADGGDGPGRLLRVLSD